MALNGEISHMASSNVLEERYKRRKWQVLMKTHQKSLYSN